MSGKTGLESEIPPATEHLDISVYYVSGQVTINDTVIGVSKPDFGHLGLPDPYNEYFGVFRQSGNYFGYVKLIDPLWVWPLLERDVNNVSYACQ
jgi:hypothetical protein